MVPEKLIGPQSTHMQTKHQYAGHSSSKAALHEGKDIKGFKLHTT